MNSDAATILLGWRLTLLLLVLQLAALAFNVVQGMTLGQPDFVSAGLFGLSTLLIWPVYRGKLWARIELCLLWSTGAVEQALSGAPAWGAFSFLLALALFFTPQVNAYMEYAAQQ
ncbi:hypothetical protein [Deinococcus multiflagellatus]|uniref:Uncharacterized protein n=1 Tax=Deinococcus multiflagellatus TaxID=1656887 RepID=A0ABW1ZFF4_9DEIO|nr:hypothetical protein [Deinococcus multiflagellatus]MBZ9712830.1 hypothetical protein [Deinococcus multiflagellatus]